MADASTTNPTDIGPRVATAKHWLYTEFIAEWQQLGHVREGTGGFKDGTYLRAHPREWEDHASATPTKPTKKLKARRALARYDNLASTMLEAFKSALFREQPTRRVGEEDKPDAPVSGLESWWEDIDRTGTHIDDAMPGWWDLAATFGHIALYFEIPSKGADTAADEEAPYVRVYLPEDILNWLCDENGKIISIKVAEAVLPTTYQELKNTPEVRIRIIDEQGWKLYSQRGVLISEGLHELGVLPVAWLFGKRRAKFTEIGQAVLGDPRLYIDVFNLTSELRELLRNQTFSFINLPLGTGQDAMTVEQAQAMLGQQTGTMNVLFSGGPASILSGDAANVTAYQEEIQKTTRQIYRGAGVQWESDSNDAEAEGSLKIKREDMNTRLSAFADECQRTEYMLAELWYRWQHGADTGKDQMVKDAVVINYPQGFDATPFTEVLEQVQAAQSINMPPKFMKALRKSLVSKFEGMANLAPKALQDLLDAIDQAPDDITPSEQVRLKLADQAGAFGQKPGMPKSEAA